MQKHRHKRERKKKTSRFEQAPSSYIAQMLARSKIELDAFGKPLLASLDSIETVATVNFALQSVCSSDCATVKDGKSHTERRYSGHTAWPSFVSQHTKLFRCPRVRFYQAISGNFLSFHNTTCGLSVSRILEGKTTDHLIANDSECESITTDWVDRIATSVV